MEYDMPLFRPPSEAYSLIIQATLGCSNNTCKFCGMYKMKKFTVRPFDEFKEDVIECARLYPHATRIFLADGDALAIKTPDLSKRLRLLYAKFPNLERVTSYANPKNLLKKSTAELSQLREDGLDILYFGMESGSDEVLKKINKSSTASEILEAGQKALEAGFPLSVTIILGLGGKALSEPHIMDTAALCSKMNPTYLSALSLMLGPLEDYYSKEMGPDFEFIDKFDMLNELRLLVQNLDTENCVFRTNHASNYLSLKGVLSKDRATLVTAIDTALANPDRYLKKEFFRAL